MAVMADQIQPGINTPDLFQDYKVGLTLENLLYAVDHANKLKEKNI